MSSRSKKIKFWHRTSRASCQRAPLSRVYLNFFKVCMVHGERILTKADKPSSNDMHLHSLPHKILSHPCLNLLVPCWRTSTEISENSPGLLQSLSFVVRAHHFADVVVLLLLLLLRMLLAPSCRSCGSFHCWNCCSYQCIVLLCCCAIMLGC